MSESPALLKDRLRRELRSESERHRAEEAVASRQLVLRLKEEPLWKASRSVLFYSALPGEPDLSSLLQEALADGKTVAFPRYMAATESYITCQITDASRDLAPGRYGIFEPRSSCAELPLNRLDFLLVPGVAFDLSGARLGRGKGYFDRLLARALGVRCGVAFDWQVLPELPTEPHDVRVDCLVTPSQWRFFRTSVTE
jgi:5-formyltetrahydrofolate cyclo-ligase